MKKLIYTGSGIFLFLVIMGVASRGDWHLKRNKRNKLPKGKLKLIDSDKYQDESGRVWILQPDSKNLFHQPAHTPVPAPDHSVLYPNIIPPPKYNPDYPNLKFLSPDGHGGSYEAIIQPDGSFLLTGKKQGTYNYSDPSGLWGYTKHIFLDVLPHLFSADYKEGLNKRGGCFHK